MSSSLAQLLIRPEAPPDFDAIDDVVARAFDSEPHAQLVRALRDDPDAYIPELTVVAESDGAIAGHVMLTNATITGDEVWRVLALGPIAVAPERQRTGVGSALMEASLARADERGDAMVVLLGHPSYYPRFGFEPARARGIEPPTPMVVSDPFMMKPLANYDEKYRGKFAFAPAFDQI